MSTRRTARRRTIRAAAPPRPRQHHEHVCDELDAGCACPDPTYSTGPMPFGDFPGEDVIVALLRCKICGRRPPAGWSPDGWTAPRGAGTGQTAGGRPTAGPTPSAFTI